MENKIPKEDVIGMIIGGVAEAALEMDINNIKKSTIRSANATAAKVNIGQRYSDQPILEIDVAPGQNLVFKPSDTTLGGTPFASLILRESNFALDYTCINVEKSEMLKRAMQAEAFADDKPYTEGWSRLSQRLAVEHGNPKFPFCVLATDNGFSLLPKPLANVFMQFAEKHVEVVEYLKVLTQLSVGITPVNVLVSKDLYWKDDGSPRPNKTDGMSLIDQDVLLGLSVERNTGVQFRCLSSEVVEGLRKHDWSDFNVAWAEYFAAAKVDAVATLINDNQDWNAFGPDFSVDAKLHQAFPPPPFSVKAAKAMMVEQFGEAHAKDRWKVWDGLKKFSSKLKGWWSRNAPIILKPVSWMWKPEVGVHLFSKGAALPAPRLWQQIKLITEAEIGGTGFDIPGVTMITPKANFKCHGKKAMAATLNSGGGHVVSMHMAVISQVSGGSMVTTPQCLEAGGTGLFKDMSDLSLKNWNKAKTIYGDKLQAIFDSLGVQMEIDSIQPIDLQKARCRVNAELWEKEALKESSYPGDPLHLLATERGMESFVRKTSKEMSGIMIQGRKRATNAFRLLCMATFVEPGEVAVPAFLEKLWEEDAVAQKQPIANTSNNTTIKVKFATKGSKVGNAIESMGLDRNVNAYFGSEYDCVLKWFADDDGDVLNITFVNKLTGEEISFDVRLQNLPEGKRQDLMNQMTSYFMATVKMARLKPAAAELPAMELSAKKGHPWTDMSVPGTSPLDKYGLFIGSFVNQASLVSCAGHKFGLEQYGINKVEFGVTLSVHATLDNQGELDAPKKDKPSVPLMVVHFYKQWDEEKGQWFVPESVIDHLVPWCLMVRNGKDWPTFTMPELNGQPGRVVINPSRYVIKEVDGNKVITLDGVQVSQLEYDENLLWCNRDVLERLFGDTFAYVSWLQKMILPKGHTQHNYVTHYRSGNRFVNEGSLRERVDKVGNGFVTSVAPLAPVNQDMEAGLFAGASSLTGRSGFGVNLKTGKTAGPDFRYMGDETLPSVSHEILIQSFWRKLYSTTGINPFKCRVAVEEEIKRGKVKSSFYNLVTAKDARTKSLLIKNIFGREMSSFELFKTIYAPFVGEDGLDVMPREDFLKFFKKKQSFTWRKANGSFGSEAMVDLCLAFAKHEILSKGEPASPDLLAKTIIANLTKGEFTDLLKRKDFWTILLDYCLIPIQKRWELHALPCPFAKILAEINWKSLANKPDSTQGIVIRTSALHRKYIGTDLSECRCCRSILTQGLKSLGRKEDTIKLETFKKDMADYLTATQFAFGKPVVQQPKGLSTDVPSGWVNGRKVEAKDRVAYLQESGQWMSISDWNDGVPEFFGDFYTKSNVRKDNGYGVQTVMKSVDGVVTDEDGATAMDSYKFSDPTGFILLAPESSKEATEAWVNKSKAREKAAETEYGRTGVNVVWIEKSETVEITTVPPAVEAPGPRVIETPPNTVVDSYDEIEYDPSSCPPDAWDY